MSVVAPPPQDELELLIREARERQRKRRLIGASVVAAAAASALAIYGGVSAGSSSNTVGGKGNPVFVGGLPRCRTSQLRLSAPGWGAAAGSFYENATLTNVSGTSCAVAGWPAVRRFDRAGRVIPVRLGRWVYEMRGATPYRAVPLAPGRAATFEIFGEDWNHRLDRACPWARSLEVEPRGGGGWLSATPLTGEGRRGIPACRAWELGPLVAGRKVNPPFVALSVFYSPPTQQHRYFAGQMNGTKWELHARDSGDGRYCFSVVTDGVARGGKCGRFYRPGVAGKLGFIARSGGRAFVAGAVISRAKGIAVHLSDGGTRYVGTMPPTRLLAPGISFFFTTIPRGTRPVQIDGHTRLGRAFVIWKRAR
jgi:hypothetical protein